MIGGGHLSPIFTFGALGVLAVAVGLAAISSVTSPPPTPGPGGTASCQATWPGYPLPPTAVLPGEDVTCSSIEAYGQALQTSCDASCGASCELRSTGHNWDCTNGPRAGSFPESYWVCPGSQWDSCVPRPPSPCETDDSYCNGNSSDQDCEIQLVQEFRPGQISSYLGVPAGKATHWSVGDTITVESETFTIECIAIGDETQGGDTNCGNTTATFDIVVVDRAPAQEYRTGTCVFQ